MGKTILAVDDELQTRDFVSTVLEENGYTPVLAENGEEAMEIIRQNKPDLVILDIMMPKQSGIKMYRELKRTESFKDIPVIVCSGLPRRTYLRAQAALTETSGESVPHPDAYLEKPVTPERLEDTIKKVLG
ncbi:MAG: response regulator [Deltaproteobacteria bacterium]|nr:response regulator [Deltaproteobacteria bacterium]